MWCNPCRAVGMIHCAHPDECGNMLPHNAAADNWKAWLDDLPLDDGFSNGIGQVQDFISGTIARAEAAEADNAALLAQVAELRAVRREDAMELLAAHGQAQEAYAAQLAAEAERDYTHGTNEVLRAENQRIEAERDALRAKVARLEGALHNCVGMLDCLVAESGRSIEWDQEDPFRMGEWFEPDDIKQLAQARAALIDRGK